MTPKQSARRWRFRLDFYENMLVRMWMEKYGVSQARALDEIRRKADKALDARFEYPFRPEDQ